MQNSNGDFICYYVEGFFDTLLEDKENANELCKFLSKRDEKEYTVEQIYLMTVPDYQDEEVMEQLKKLNDTEIEINLIIDDCPEHYAYCKNIDEAINTLKELKGKREEPQDNYFELSEAYFRGVPGKLDLEKFLKNPDSYIFKSQKTGKPWSKEASQKIIRCRFCTHSRFGQKQCPGCKYFIREEEVKEYEALC